MIGGASKDGAGDRAPTDDPPDELRPLRGLSPLVSPGADPSRRARLVEVIEDEIARVPAERRRELGRTRFRVRALGGLAIAAGVSLAFFFGARSTEDARVTPNFETPASSALVRQARETSRELGGAPRPLERGTLLGAGSELTTREGGRSEIALGSRVRVDLAEKTRLELRDLDPKHHRLGLELGRVDVAVEKMPGTPERLAIETPDSVVEVRGTVFSVEVKAEAGRLVTFVEVTRGRVVVQHGKRSHSIEAGARFRSDGVPLAHARAPSAVVEPGRSVAPRAVEPLGTGEKSSPRAVETTAARGSTLAEQNRLFERGLAARDRGDERAALGLFAELLTKYPDSPLRHAAEEERKRAVARLEKAP